MTSIRRKPHARARKTKLRRVFRPRPRSYQAFFTAAFGWTFVDYGPDYTSFSGEGLDGGFFKSELSASTENGSALLVFYSENLEKTLEKIEASGGIITRAIFSFPGGRRFHFTEPSGNELAVWSDQEVE